MTEGSRKPLKYIVLGFLAGMAAAFGIMIIVMTGFGPGPAVIPGSTYDYYKQLDERYSKLNTIYDEVMTSYYIEPDETAMQEMMYKGLITGLEDPYSAYMTAEEYDSYEESITGEFEGIGIVFSTDNDGNYTVIQVYKDSPADKAGLKSGDLLLKADGKYYDTMEEMSAHIKGKAGTIVKLTYSRDGKENTVPIKRDKIVSQTVESKLLDDNIGYIAITGFEGHTGDDFQKALDEMEKKSVSGLVIDLRDNGGGTVATCLEVTDALMGESVIVSMEDRFGNSEEYTSDKEATKLPYVVLVNENSASAAEIMAAAVKDNTDNPVVGTTTFGKGIVQMSSELDDGSALKLTIMQYFSPDGTVIHKKGVKPDFTVKNNGDIDVQLQKALELLKK